jgi:hypothetical protein
MTRSQVQLRRFGSEDALAGAELESRVDRLGR